MFLSDTYVEIIVLHSHKKPDGHFNVKAEFGKGECKILLDENAKSAETTSPMRELGSLMYDPPNAVEELKHLGQYPTGEKVEAIKGAMRHFEIK